MTNVPDAAVDLVEDFEGFRANPYRCPAGVWTIGFGSTRDANGKPVCPTTPAVTQEQARELARRDLMAAAAEGAGSVHVPLTEGQTAALEDFVYNLGSGNFRSSTLLRKLNAGDYEGAALEFAKWNLGGGHVLAGLVRRRAAETNLFK